MVAGANDGGFSIHDVKCPSCNGPLELPQDAEAVTCPFCGSTVRISYGGNAGQAGGVEPDGSIRDRATGYGLFRVRAMPKWRITRTALVATGSSSRPNIPQVEFGNQAGGFVSLAMGDAGTRRSAAMNSIMGMYGSQVAGLDRANYAEVPDPIALADAVVSSVASGMGASSARFVRQLACPDLESKRQRGFEWFQRLAQAQGGRVANPFIGVVLRVYELSSNGGPWKAASFVSLSAVKDASGLDGGLGSVVGGFGGLFGGLGNLFGGAANQAIGTGNGASQQPGGTGNNAADFFLGGGLIGKMRRDKAVQSAQPQQAYPAAPQNMAPLQARGGQGAGQSQWCMPDYNEYVSDGTVYWSVDLVATFVAPQADFDSEFERTFLPFVDSVEVHHDVENLALQAVMQESGQIGQSTQAQLARNDAAFQAQQAARRQQQAAFNSYNQSISDNRNARHQQFMASSHARMERSAPDYSEAIRGVNTYTTSDGREVELSVHADRVYENQAGDVIGISGSFDPGASWTEIPRT